MLTNAFYLKVVYLIYNNQAWWVFDFELVFGGCGAVTKIQLRPLQSPFQNRCCLLAIDEDQYV